MAKTHRGKGLRNQPAHGKGTCPICKTTSIKVLYERSAPDGATIKVCKRCRRRPFPAAEPAPAGRLASAERMLKELELS
jgi:hypothetical protein